MNQRQYGALPSPPDARDWKISNYLLSAAAALPVRVDHREKMQPVRNQGPYPTCVAMSGAATREYQEKIEHPEFNHYISPRFIYNLRANVAAPNPSDSEGMYLRDLMKILSEVGSLLEMEFPYADVARKPTEEEQARAEKYRIVGYARISTVDELRGALYTYGACVIAFPVYDHDAPEMWRPLPGSKRIAGHAVTAVGYDDGRRVFILRNSWGAKWNGDGHVLLPYDDWKYIWEGWSTVDGGSPTPPPAPDDGCGCACCGRCTIL